MSPKTLHEQFKVGAVVAYDSHPIASESLTDMILLGGESQNIPPFMIVTEVVAESSTLRDELTGDVRVSKNNVQCRCIWFSSRNQSLEEAWISSRFLKAVKAPQERLFREDSDGVRDYGMLTKSGTQVVLTTNAFEISKKKTFLKYTGARPDGNGNGRSVTGLLSFVCPVMTVVGTQRSTTKEPFLDSKGNIKREISRLLVKCRYYNHAGDKYSELSLPIEAIIDVPVVSKEELNKVAGYVTNQKTLSIEKLHSAISPKLFQPKEIVYACGYYTVKGIDVISGKPREVSINELTGLGAKEIDPIVANRLPEFEAQGENKFTLKKITQSNVRKLDPSKYWRITYRKKKDAEIVRVISKQELVQVLIPTEEGEVGDPKIYLRAFCHLRNEYRHFRIDRIRKIEELSINFAHPELNQPAQASEPVLQGENGMHL